jgi:dimethylargininase
MFCNVITWAEEPKEAEDKIRAYLSTFNWNLIGTDKIELADDCKDYGDEFNDLLAQAAGNPSAIIWAVFTAIKQHDGWGDAPLISRALRQVQRPDKPQPARHFEYNLVAINFEMLIALTRDVSHRIAECELTFIDRQPIDFLRAVQQHSEYRQLLRDLGAVVIDLPRDDRCPDCCFLEDTALVLDEIAVITRPGTETRLQEVDGVAPTVMKYRNVVRIDAPGTLEGGDILRMGRNLFVGLSARTNQHGIAQLRNAVQTYGYIVIAVELKGALHLKSVCTALDDNTVLADRRLFDTSAFSEYRMIEVPAAEPSAANVLRINGAICMHAAFHQTAELLQTHGFEVRTVDVSEFLKAEAALTCMSIPFYAPDDQLT